MENSVSTPNTQRLYYLDWLRVLAFGLLFVFHATRFFDHFPWHVKNDEHSIIASFIVGFIHGWRMHLIFFISGVGTFFALRSRKNLFVKDRFKRLFISFLFGIILIIPPQKFYEAIFNGWFQGNLLEFIKAYPSFLLHEAPGFSLRWTGRLGYHVWYLAFLFVMTLLSLPILKLVLKKNTISNFLSKISRYKFGVLLFLTLIIILDYILRPIFPRYLDWADFAHYGMYFLLGYICMVFMDLTKFAKENIYYFLVFGIISSMASLYLFYEYPEIHEGTLGAPFYINIFASSIAAFSWVMFFFGLSQRKLNFNHKYLSSLNIGILPFYILHQTVIIIIGYYVISYELSILLKFLVILTISLITNILLYQLIRRVNMLRFLFGMKKLK